MHVASLLLILGLAGSSEAQEPNPMAEALLAQYEKAQDEADFEARLEASQGLLRIYEAEDPAGEDTSRAYRRLAMDLYELGRLEASWAAHEKGLALMEAYEEQALSTWLVAWSNAAGVAMERGDLQTARNLFEKAAGAAEALGEPKRQALLQNGIAVLLVKEGRFADAASRFEQSLALRERLYDDAEHIELATPMQNLAWVYRRTGRFEDAIATYGRAMAIWEKHHGADDARIANALTGQARTLAEMGDSKEALSVMERALEIQERSAGVDSLNAAKTRVSLGVMARGRGELVSARQHYERARPVFLRELGRDHTEMATLLGNLANVMREQGDAQSAVPLAEEALSILQSRHGPTHPKVAWALQNLALMLSAEEAERALELYESSLEIFLENFEPPHPEIADALVGIGTENGFLGNPEEARDFTIRALTMWKALRGDRHPHVAKVLVRLASYEKSMNRATEAAYLEEALSIQEATLGPDHPELGYTLKLLALNRRSEGRSDDARRLAERAMNIQTRAAELVLWGISDRERLTLMRHRRATLDTYLHVFSDPGDASRAWERVLAWKGAGRAVLLAQREAERSALEQGNQEVIELYAVRRRIASLVLSPYESDDVNSRREQLSQLTASKEKLERRLVSGADRQGALEGSAAEIARSLGRKEALVDVLSVETTGGLHYAAFIATRRQVERIDLGPVDDIDHAIAEWRAVLADGHSTTERIDRRGRAVHALVWAPIASVVGATSRVYLIPDGSLAELPFAAVPTATGYLIEDVEIAYLDHAADLVRDAYAAKRSSVLLVGSLDYTSEAKRQTPCANSAWEPLPATAAEIEDIGERFRSVTRLTGREATAEAVSAAIEGRRIVHFATHGFFAGPECASSLRRGGGDIIGFDPMVLSGIVLSPTDDDDGIWTAAEVASSDLAGTELVVLSACETGLGEVVHGEGVLGLRRAFSVAGAENVVMSLWSVPDVPTQELMGAFYADLSPRIAPSKALRNAQLIQLEANRQRQGDGRPQDWAAFISAGR